MFGDVLKIDDFLEPRTDPGVEELSHVVAAHNAPVDNDRYEELGQVEPWPAFNHDNVKASATLKSHLASTFRCQWSKSWIPDFDRIIYSERQLESLFNKTLMCRVNYALHVVTSSSQEPAVIAVVGPGSFDSYHPDHIDGKGTTILPDWIVVEGNYTLRDINLPDLEDLALQDRILVVGDTKMIRQSQRKSRATEAAEVVPGTHSCRRGSLAQLQHYSTMLRTRFGFILSNRELVAAQFLREEETTPRSVRRLGLRSLTQPGQLREQSGLSSSDSWYPGDKGENDDDDASSLPTPRPQRKRTHQECSPNTSPITPRRTRAVADAAKTSDVASSPPQLPHRALSSPAPPYGWHHHSTRAASNTNLSPLHITSQVDTNEQEVVFPSSTSYAPSERSYEVGRVLVRSFEISNEFMEDNSKRANALREHEAAAAQPMHPAKALFALIMLARSVGVEGRRIGTEEIEF